MRFRTTHLFRRVIQSLAVRDRMAHDVFLSHSSKDKPIADAMCASLESAGVRCWIAPRDILPSTPYAEAILEGIKGSRVLVLILSSQSNASPQVMREVERAVHFQIPILPFRTEEVAPSADLEYFVSATHWLDAMTPPLDKHLQYLVQTVQILLARTPAHSQSAPVTTAAGDSLTIEPDPLLSTLEHENAVMALAFSPDGRYLAAASGDVVLWNVASGEMEDTLQGHEASVRSVAFSPDGRYMASGGEDHAIALWDFATRKIVRKMERQEDVLTVAFSSDSRLLATGGRENNITLWDVSTGALAMTLEGHANWIFSLAFGANGRSLISGSADSTAMIWELASGKPLWTFKADDRKLKAWVTTVALSKDGRFAATGGNRQTSKLWDTATGKLARSLRAEPGALDLVEAVAFSIDGRVLAVSGEYLFDARVDHAVKLYEVAGGKVVRSLAGHKDKVYCLAFSPDGKLLASGSEDSKAKLWRWEGAAGAQVLSAGQG
ncbi:MAG TPA: TIR domain-containing protein [Candidatus Angelobacter sp.]|nr:TIR domain-containing protein [Candidatus Angelobacter sp.]